MATAIPLLDANVVIRHLTRDEPAHAERARALLKQIEDGPLRVTLLESAVAEIVYVLGSRRLYNLPRDRIRDLLAPLLALRGIKLAHKRTHLAALDLYAQHPHLSFVDALMAAHAQRAGGAVILSFDTDFDAVEAIDRREPSGSL